MKLIQTVIQYIETESIGGISENIKSKIVDPFFTTKDKGLGLSLSVAYKIVNQYDYQIEIFDTPAGTKFLLMVIIV